MKFGMRLILDAKRTSYNWIYKKATFSIQGFFQIQITIVTKKQRNDSSTGFILSFLIGTNTM